MIRAVLPLMVACLSVCHSHRASGAEIDFAHDIMPVLRQHCGQCHAGDQKQGGLSLNTRQGLVAGGESGPVVVPGNSGESELLQRIATDDEFLRMPPEGPPVPAEKVALLERWIDAGVPWDEGLVLQKPAYEPPLRPRRPELPAAVAGREHPVDRIIDAYLADHELPRGEPAADHVFARRLYLDVIGLLPEPDLLEAFLADPSSDKRGRLVRELLDRELDYAEHWLTFWNDLLRNDYTGTGFITGGRKQITGWLYQALVDNKPYDQFVRELVAPSPEAEGFIRGIRWRGDVSASQTQEVQFSQSISQSFLGLNMKCASCHDSFVDRWTLDEAYGLAAVYAAQPLELYRCDQPTGNMAEAAWIFPELGQIDPQAPQPERLKQLAGLMTHPENGRLTRTIVNRIWHRLMGRGIVHPTDAMDAEPWNADLLDYLAVHLAENGYDLKKTIELICTSQAYQAVTPPIDSEPEGGEYRFRGPVARRMTAEQFMDAVWQITDAAPTRFDAEVVRASPGGAGGSEPAEVRGQWVWAYAEASSNVPQAGETITVRRQFELPGNAVRAFAVITCDNAYTLYVNGHKVQSDDNWETVETVALQRHLKAGDNEILIVARNAGSSPNPAGLFFEAHIRLEDDSEHPLFTDAAWQWTAQVPDGRGRFAGQPDDWKPAAAVRNPQLWNSRVGGQLAASLARGTAGPVPRVRASLVKNDALMRSLGRPNRDQIVSMRPNALTTLEAIDLANAQILADTIAAGARHVLDGHRDDPSALATGLFTLALSRQPTGEELELAAQLLGPQPSEHDVQDLIWAVLMLPEFQLVR